MLRFTMLVTLSAMIAGCSDGESAASDVALADNGVPVAALPTSPTADRQALVNPVVPTLQTMAAPDFAVARMQGAGCKWRASEDVDALFAFDTDSGVVKVGGSHVRMLPDRASGALPTGAFRAYEGGQWRVAIEGGGDSDRITRTKDGAEWRAAMTLSVDGGPSQRFDDGILSCRD